MSAGRLALLLAAASLAAGSFTAGCGESGPREPSPVHIPRTTTRFVRPPPVEGRDLDLEIYASEEDCNRVLPDPGSTQSEEEVQAVCLPHVDRASGEVRVSFEVRQGDENYPLPLTDANKDLLRVAHQGQQVRDDAGQGQAYTLIPHEPVPANQMFIVLIDGSASMNQPFEKGTAATRLDAVRQALLTDGVRKAFFPQDRARTSVVLFQFVGPTPTPLGGKIAILEDEDDYTRYVKQYLTPNRGYTFLFDAINYASTTLLAQEDIRGWLDISNAQPTIIALTDGFNNMDPRDACRDNVPRLQKLLENLRAARTGGKDQTRYPPTVYPVALGKKIRKAYTLPTPLRTEAVTEREICGKYAGSVISGGLETLGIDNVSMQWIAAFGGGVSYAETSRQGLGQAFQNAAARRYKWFEVRYRVDPFHLRRAFDTGLDLMAFASAEGHLRVHPSAWLDAPPGVRMADGWTRPSPYRATLALVLSWMAGLIFLSYVGAAWFNTKRALFGRTRPPRAPRG